jgi:putative addiction module component (TIGR02574 family)
MTKQEILLEEALKLSPVERAELIERLLSSFEFRSRKEVDDLWAKEADDRIAAYEQGKIAALPAEVVGKRTVKKHRPGIKVAVTMGGRKNWV